MRQDFAVRMCRFWTWVMRKAAMRAGWWERKARSPISGKW